MTHTLTIALGDDADLRWAQHTVTAAHHAPILTYLFTNLTSLIRKEQDMLDSVTITPAIAILTGAELRRIVEAEPRSPHAQTLRRIGNLDVQLVRLGNKWTLYLADLAPIPHGTRNLWATAVSAPSVEWDQTPDGCAAWCQWTEVRP